LFTYLLTLHPKGVRTIDDFARCLQSYHVWVLIEAQAQVSFSSCRGFPDQNIWLNVKSNSLR
jgi:hypothetical protein